MRRRRGGSSITVSGATGLDGLMVAPNTHYTFTVDYAGAVADVTPPSLTNFAVDFCLNSTTTASASWSATDPNSAITLYRYTLGSAPNGTDVINWTTTLSTTITRTGLNLVMGRQYFFSVQARNAGGLWSAVTSRSFVAGVPCNKVYLPLVVR
jgi:Tfp pilus assembly protein PilW